MLSHYDRRVISTERWPKRKKARGVCTSNKPINKLIDAYGFIYFYDAPMMPLPRVRAPCAILSSQRLPLIILFKLFPESKGHNLNIHY